MRDNLRESDTNERLITYESDNLRENDKLREVTYEIVITYERIVVYERDNLQETIIRSRRE